MPVEIINNPEQITSRTEVLRQGVLFFVSEKILQHKLRDGKGEDFAYCYFETSKFPKKFAEEIDSYCISKSPRLGYSVEKIIGCADYAITDKPFYGEVIDVREFDLRLYLAVNGKVGGFFVLTSLLKADKAYNEMHKLRFHSENWHEIKDGDILKPSQGWRYYPK